MVESIRNLDWVLISKPCNTLFSQLGQTFLIQPISNNHRNMRTYLPLKINNPRQTKSQNHFQDQHVLVILIPFITVILRQVTNIIMNENV